MTGSRKFHALCEISAAVALLAVGTGARAQAADGRGMGAVIGPKLICFKYSRFSLLEGERIVAFRAGVHAMSIDLEGPAGSYQISEGDIFRGPSRPGRRVARRPDAAVYRVRDPDLRYAIYGKTGFSDGRDMLVLWLEGDALAGASQDASIYDRLVIGDTRGLNCEHVFIYGWDLFLGPVSD